jgi:hypothetical protein
LSAARRSRPPSQPAVVADRRVALLGSRKALVTLRRRVALDGRWIVIELPSDHAKDGSGKLASRIAELAAGEKVDELIVLRAADAFSSVDELAEALKFLDAHGVGFESLEEPWLALRTSAAPAATGIGGLTALLESRAAHFLDLSIERLEADHRAGEEKGRREAIKAEVGKVVAQLLVLGPYAVAVGIVSQAVLHDALLDPDLLVRRLRDFVTGSNAVNSAVTGAIPDALKGIVFSAVSSLVLLVFRGTSIGLRAELGGVLFMGFVTLSIYGLTAGFGTGVVGSLIALPGLVLAVVVTFEFTHMVLRITSSPGAEATPDTGRGIFARIRRLLSDLGRRAHPTGSIALAAAFVGLPLISVLVFLAAAATDPNNGGWLFWPARIALFVLAGWSAWACLATPSAVRIPLWSTLGWAALLLLLSAATVVTAAFAVVIVLLLASGVFELVFRHSDQEAPSAARA